MIKEYVSPEFEMMEQRRVLEKWIRIISLTGT
jgi:hypothetical protein